MTTDEILERHTAILTDHTRRLDHHTVLLQEHTELLTALNEKADTQTEHLAAIAAQLEHMNEGIIRALTAAIRYEALEQRVAALEAKRNGGG